MSLEQTMEEARGLPDLKDISVPVLERYFRRLFALADTDENGVLDPREFHNLLEKSGLGFSKRLIRRVLLEADVNQDGMIQWDEFIPVMLEIVDAHRVQQHRAEDEAEARDQARQFLLKEVPKERIERSMMKMFFEADVDNNGVLDKGEFLACMRTMDFGLTRKEINYLLSQVDVNQDGFVSYEEFIPVGVDILVEIIKDKILESQTSSQVQQHFFDVFASFDSKGDGRLTLTELRDALSSVGLSTIQVQTIVAEAEVNHGSGDRINIKSFSRVVAQMFSDFFEWRKNGDLGVVGEEQAAEPAVEEDASQEQSVMSPAELERFLRQLFYQADVESNGFLRPRDFGQLLRGSGLGFSNKTIRKIIEEADVDADGRIDYLEFVSSIADIIESEQAKERHVQTHWEDEARARAAAAEFLLKGVSRDWLERTMLKVFVQCDVNNNGTLDLREFKNCLRVFDLGLTNKEITFVMSEVDANKDGVVSYQEFVPCCFELLVDMIKEKFMDDHGQLRTMEYFQTVFADYDHNNAGKLSLSQLREALSASQFTLSAVQVEAVLAEAVQDEGGMVQWKPFSRVAAMIVGDLYGLSDDKQVAVSQPAPSSGDVVLNPEVEAMVQRYEGDREAVKSRALAAQPGLRGKLTDLAAQLARVQDENDMIRQRYMEVEDAWQAMGDENNSLKHKNTTLSDELEEKTASLEEAQTSNQELQSKWNETHANFLQQRDLAQETKQMLIAEQLEMNKKTQEANLLRRESVDQENELRKLRDAWNEREARMARLEEQRGFYEQELTALGSSYQALVNKLSFVVSDYSVRTTPIQVRVGGGYELLSNYLNRVFEEQDAVARRYARVEKFPVSPEAATSPHRFPTPHRGSPAKSSNNPLKDSRVYYEPLQGQLANWPDQLRSPSSSPQK
eukprot:TRINITY_DN605_c0_g1_i1.p1 TRINITY_DN605_c0_g1~~TRINITY_DN605_c0_g1_i1.p1  ORF type:complete len:906 (+),score=358.01 TRINITY_DN605_c0_g1_i1:120-2837(+)